MLIRYKCNYRFWTYIDKANFLPIWSLHQHPNYWSRTKSFWTLSKHIYHQQFVINWFFHWRLHRKIWKILHCTVYRKTRKNSLKIKSSLRGFCFKLVEFNRYGFILLHEATHKWNEICKAPLFINWISGQWFRWEENRLRTMIALC